MKFILGILFSMFNLSILAQCDSKGFIDKCWTPSADFYLSKTRLVKINSKKTALNSTYEVTFSKGTNYLITVCKGQESPNQMMVQLLDKNQKLIMANYSSKNKKFYNKMLFSCKASDSYYLRYFFKGGTGGCGATSIGFKKQ